MDQRLDSTADGFPELVTLESVDSTNTHLAGLWQKNTELSAFSTVVAGFQTGGKGRLGRQWVAPPGTSLLCSVLVPVPLELLTWVPLTAGLAAVELLRPSLDGARTSVKWPNDVLIGDKKVGGILAEHLGTRRGLEWVAVGIGINLTQTSAELPEQVGNALPATSVVLEGGPVLDPELLAIAVAASIREHLEQVRTDGVDALRGEYSDWSWTLNQDVVVSLPDNTTVSGRAVAIGIDGALTIQDSTGNTHIIHAGDVVNARALPTNGPLSGGPLETFGN